MELRQVILHYFEEDKDPVGLLGQTALVVGGKHCRLSNIDENGRFRRSEAYWYNGEEVKTLQANTQAPWAGLGPN